MIYHRADRDLGRAKTVTRRRCPMSEPPPTLNLSSKESERKNPGPPDENSQPGASEPIENSPSPVSSRPGNPLVKATVNLIATYERVQTWLKEDLRKQILAEQKAREKHRQRMEFARRKIQEDIMPSSSSGTANPDSKNYMNPDLLGEGALTEEEWRSQRSWADECLSGTQGSNKDDQDI
mmetsp:Transcript_31794/g.62214  ORF Transcript_31794/g.62214 Transcript_31794/m.62214 type:complete len:180 (-) Transcript_31794:103-642(-)